MMYPESTAGYFAKKATAYSGIERRNFIIGIPSLYNPQNALFREKAWFEYSIASYIIKRTLIRLKLQFMVFPEPEKDSANYENFHLGTNLDRILRMEMLFGRT